MYLYKDRGFYNPKDLAISVIGGKWKIPIVWHLLHYEPLRLSELNKYMPQVTQRMLTRQLRELEEDGIIERTVYPVVPPKVEYHLTEIGHDLAPVVDAICDWGEEFVKKNQLEEVDELPPVF